MHADLFVHIVYLLIVKTFAPRKTLAPLQASRPPALPPAPPACSRVPPPLPCLVGHFRCLMAPLTVSQTAAKGGSLLVVCNSERYSRCTGHKSLFAARPQPPAPQGQSVAPSRLPLTADQPCDALQPGLNQLLSTALQTSCARACGLPAFDLWPQPWAAGGCATPAPAPAVRPAQPTNTTTATRCS